MTVNNSPCWNVLRSHIYIRDKGICWICNRFVCPKDYDLGHLVDRCNGGLDAYDNLAVMHRWCNLTKPQHQTLEDAMRWKLTPAYLYHAPAKVPKPISEDSIILESFRRYGCSPLMASLTPDSRDAIKQFIIEYFAGHPELLRKGKIYNRATRQLAATLGIEVPDVRLILAKSRTGDTIPLPNQERVSK